MSTTPEVKEMLLQQLLTRFPLLPLHPESKYFIFSFSLLFPTHDTDQQDSCPSHPSGKENPNLKQSESLR